MKPMRMKRPIHRRRMAGVTLLELMIVVVVIAVLGAVAIPSYREYTRRAHRAEAKGANALGEAPAGG